MKPLHGVLFVGFQVYDGNLGCIGKEGANSDGFLVAGTYKMGPRTAKGSAWAECTTCSISCFSAVTPLVESLYTLSFVCPWSATSAAPEGRRQPSSALGNGDIVPVRRFAVCDNVTRRSIRGSHNMFRTLVFRR